MKFCKVAIVYALLSTSSAVVIQPSLGNQSLVKTQVDIMSNGQEVSTAGFSSNDTIALLNASNEAKTDQERLEQLRKVDETLKAQVKRENHLVEQLGNELFVKKIEEKEAN